MTTIQLISPSMEYAKDIQNFRSELISFHDADSFAGCSCLENYERAEEWLAHLDRMKHPNDGHVPSDTYLGIRIEDHKIIGIIDLRHHIQHPVLGLWGGHIGYSVRPDERGKGYGKELLRLVLINARHKKMDKVLVTCSENNYASEQVILANGGIFEKYVLVDNQLIKRYWINL